MTGAANINSRPHQRERAAFPGDRAIRPFRINSLIPEEAIIDMQQRMRRRGGRKRDGAGPTRACSWRRCSSSRILGNRYDWRKAEAKLNALPQFVTEIDGLDIQFMHVRSRHPERDAADHDARLARLGPRAAEGHRSAHRPDRPRRQRRGRLPSRPALDAGLWLFRQAARDRLGSRSHRARLGRADAAPGYKHYVSQGGDWGAIVSDVWRRQAPPGLLGIHVNMPATVPPSSLRP